MPVISHNVVNTSTPQFIQRRARTVRTSYFAMCKRNPTPSRRYINSVISFLFIHVPIGMNYSQQDSIVDTRLFPLYHASGMSARILSNAQSSLHPLICTMESLRAATCTIQVFTLMRYCKTYLPSRHSYMSEYHIPTEDAARRHDQKV